MNPSHGEATNQSILHSRAFKRVKKKKASHHELYKLGTNTEKIREEFLAWAV